MAVRNQRVCLSTSNRPYSQQLGRNPQAPSVSTSPAAWSLTRRHPRKTWSQVSVQRNNETTYPPYPT